MRGSIKLFTVLGIPVDINATWLIAVAIITWSLSTAAYPSFFGSWSTMQYWTAGLLTTLLLFASVLAHELGHSIVALAQGLKVNGITLLLFGGVSKIQGKASRPRNEFLIAFAGPAVSLVIGVVLVGWWIKFGPIYEDDVKLYHGVLFFTGWMNLLVAGFNLLPGYPMDGGRVLRSAVWGFTGDTKRATRVAYIVGKFVFYALIGWGAWQILSGDIAGGIWIAMIGYFLMTSARSEIAGEQAKQLEESDLESIDHLGFSVGVATRSMPPMIESSWSIEQMTHQGLPEDPLTSMPVGRQGELIGFVLRRDLDQVPIEHKGQISVGELMNPDSLRVISTNESFRDALRSMDRNRLNQLVVMDADYVVGIITREDIVRALLEFKTQGMHAEPMDRDTSAD
ncbi:MAG: site-2 protease family protein [Chloroflexi bacterium]|nr:site-2 protease family protein [Chloroflexota bacterium]MBT5626962.1 site-2 protease family protein [Chloroflexota bacterium]